MMRDYYLVTWNKLHFSNGQFLVTHVPGLIPLRSPFVPRLFLSRNWPIHVRYNERRSKFFRQLSCKIRVISGEYNVQFWNFVNFSGKRRVKFGHFVNFPYIYFRANMSCHRQLTELLCLCYLVFVLLAFYDCAYYNIYSEYAGLTAVTKHLSATLLVRWILSKVVIDYF